MVVAIDQAQKHGCSYIHVWPFNKPKVHRSFANRPDR